MTPVPVILDTDIGTDVDDVWALAFMLCCPEIDIKLIVSDSGDTAYSAAIVCKLLEVARRTDIPVGIGIPLNTTPQTHKKWLDGYTTDQYPGIVYLDGVGAIIDVITRSSVPVTIVSIGPVPNISHLLQRSPGIVHQASFVGMHGSLRRGYLGSDKPNREYNVKQYPQACQDVFTANWPITITPLDTCGIVSLQGENFQRLQASNEPLLNAVLANHDGWVESLGSHLLGKMDLTLQSSILYDTVAVYLAFTDHYLIMEDLPVIVTDDGRTEIEETGKIIRCATQWRDLAAFELFVTERLLGGPVPEPRTS